MQKNQRTDRLGVAKLDDFFPAPAGYSENSHFMTMASMRRLKSRRATTRSVR
jgi:hypothetical protein